MVVEAPVRQREENADDQSDVDVDEDRNEDAVEASSESADPFAAVAAAEAAVHQATRPPTWMDRLAWGEKLSALSPAAVAAILSHVRRVAAKFLVSTFEAAKVKNEEIEKGVNEQARNDRKADKLVAWEWFFGPWEGWLPRVALEEVAQVLNLQPAWIRRVAREQLAKAGVTAPTWKMPPGYRYELYRPDAVKRAPRAKPKKAAALASEALLGFADAIEAGLPEPVSPAVESAAPEAAAPVTEDDRDLVAGTVFSDAVADAMAAAPVAPEEVPAVVDSAVSILETLGSAALDLLAGSRSGI